MKEETEKKRPLFYKIFAGLAIGGLLLFSFLAVNEQENGRMKEANEYGNVVMFFFLLLLGDVAYHLYKKYLVKK